MADQEQLPAEQSPPPEAAAPVVNVMDPSGHLVGLPQDQAAEGIQRGDFSPATDDDVQRYQLEQKFGTPLEQTKAGLEGLAIPPTFGLSTLAERALGVPAENINARRAVNPITHAIGEGAGMLAPIGAMGAIGAAGAAAGEGVGAALGENLIGQIGSGVVKNAVQFGLLQSEDEASKLFAGDPSQTAQTALTNIGLSSIIGGGFGTISPLWNATVGPKLGQALNFISQRANAGESVASDAAQAALEKTGMKATPEIKAALSDNPDLSNSFLDLAQSDTSAGNEVKQSLKNFREQAANTVLSAVQKTPEEVESLSDLSKAQSGASIKESLIDSFKDRLAGPVEAYETIKNGFGKTPLTDVQKGMLQERLSKLSLDEGYQKLVDSPAQKFVDGIVQSVPLQETVGDLSKLSQNKLGQALSTEGLRSLGLYGKLKGIFRDVESQIIDETANTMGPEIKAQYQTAREGYKAFMNAADEVSERLHPGSYGGAQDFLRVLGETGEEKFVDRLLGKNDAAWLGYVQKEFPNVAEQVKDWHLSKLLQNAAKGAKPGEILSPEKFVKGLSDLSPELRNMLVTPESAEKLTGVSTLLKQINQLKWNFSNTAPTLDRLSKYIPGSAISLIGMLTGHGPVKSILFGSLGRLIGRDVPDALKLGMLRFMASEQPIESEGFKAMVEYLDHTVKGESAVSKAVKGVFKSGAAVAPQMEKPSDKELQKLDTHLKDLQTNPSALLDLGKKTSHYLGDQTQALAETAASAVQYLNSLRPSPTKSLPLDREPTVTKNDQHEFQRALTVAERPLSVLPKISDGSLTIQDMKHFRTLYPALFERVSQKLQMQMMDHLSDEGKIPYKARQGLSLFLGQPMDSTMTAEGIMSAQQTFQQNASPTQPMPGARGGHAHSMKALQNIAEMDRTPSQSRQMARTQDR